MKLKFSGVILTILIALIFGFQSVVSVNAAYAQSLYHVEDLPGAGGSTTPSSSSGSSHALETTVFVLCGVAVAGLLVYKFFIQKKDTTDNQTADSSSAALLNSKNNFSVEKVLLQKSNKYAIFDPPVNFYVGIKNNFADLRKKSFILGVSIKL